MGEKKTSVFGKPAEKTCSLVRTGEISADGLSALQLLFCPCGYLQPLSLVLIKKATLPSVIPCESVSTKTHTQS